MEVIPIPSLRTLMPMQLPTQAPATLPYLSAMFSSRPEVIFAPVDSVQPIAQ